MISLERQLAQTSRHLQSTQKRAEQSWQASRLDAARRDNDAFMWE
jgi:hypothetical protein